MGLETIPDRSDSQTINQTWFNVLKSVIKGDFVPRNINGVATDEGGGLGTATYRWIVAYIKKVVIGAVGSGLSIEESSGDLVFKVGGSTVCTMKSTGLTKMSLASVGQIISSSSGSFQTSSTSFVDVTNLSVNLTVTGRPVFLGLISTETGSNGSGVLVADISVGVSGNFGELIFVRGTSQLNRLFMGQVYQSTDLIIEHNPCSAFWHIDTPSPGTYTYKVQAKIANAAGQLSFLNVKLIAFEL